LTQSHVAVGYIPKCLAKELILQKTGGYDLYTKAGAVYMLGV